MISVLGSIPQKVYVAVSGGADSMAVLDFLGRSNREVTALYFNHGTEFSNKAEDFVKEYCNKNKIPLYMGAISRSKKSDESQEEYW